MEKSKKIILTIVIVVVFLFVFALPEYIGITGRLGPLSIVGLWGIAMIIILIIVLRKLWKKN